tara:strand:+ start:1306 stop:1767 length:462 start_codon:yes stop_codon:yes gene_type:complete
VKDISNCENDIKDWIDRIGIVQKNKHPICPYARIAKYWIYKYEDRLSMELKACHFDNNFDLYVCLPTNQYMTVDEAKYIESNNNRVAKDTITLLDHPKDPGYIDGVYTGNGKYVVFLIQKKNDLLKAREQLHKSSYYDSWSNEYYKKILGKDK